MGRFESPASGPPGRRSASELHPVGGSNSPHPHKQNGSLDNLKAQVMVTVYPRLVRGIRTPALRVPNAAL
jgi:hypothetical protein